MRHLNIIFWIILCCLALLSLIGSSTALAQQTSSQATNDAVDYVSKAKVFGAQFSFQALLPTPSSSIDASGTRPAAGGSHYFDAWQRSVTLAWDWNQASSWFNYSFTTPGGRYDPGGAWNFYSGPSTHSIMSGNTVYLTKDSATAASLSTDWEVQGQQQPAKGTRPAEYFTLEWGFTRLLTLDTQKTKLLEVGLAGYDEWPVSGTIAGLPFSSISGGTSVSQHAFGFQTNLTLPEKNFNVSFKYEPEYLHRAQGPVVMVSAVWTW
jgi:hypothetical protein